MALPERPRRLRRHENIRRMVRETHLRVDDLVMPFFIRPGKGVRKAIPSMPGIHQYSVDRALEEIEACAEVEIPAILLFGIPSAKDDVGSEGYAETGVVPSAIRRIKEVFPDLVVIADVCLCEYTDHGHCGVLKGSSVENDETITLYARAATAYAEAGADIVAPSGMMDGQVAAIREALDTAGRQEVAILAYAVKYASSFYGPFRDAAESPPKFGDRRAYQMDPANAREALREVRLDLAEGADIVMVKPALPYLDVIAAVRAASDRPVAAYHVSGEYAMIKAAAAKGWIEEEKAILEVLTGIKRAGADIIVTYHAREVASLLG